MRAMDAQRPASFCYSACPPSVFNCERDTCLMHGSIPQNPCTWLMCGVPISVGQANAESYTHLGRCASIIKQQQHPVPAASLPAKAPNGVMSKTGKLNPSYGLERTVTAKKGIVNVDNVWYLCAKRVQAMLFWVNICEVGWLPGTTN